MRVVVVKDDNARRILTLPGWLELLATCARHGVGVLAGDARPAVDPALLPSPAPFIRRLPDGAGAAAVAALLRELGAEIVVSASEPDAARLRDAQAVALLRPAGCEDPGARLRAVEKALHKGLTRDACTRLGIPVSPGLWFESGASADRLPEELGARLVVKDALLWAGRGVTMHNEAGGALAALRTHRGPCVVEAFADGEEVSVEVVAGGGRALVTGWLLKGPTEASRHPLHRIRLAPAVPPPPALREAALRLVRGLGLEGVAEIELVAESRDRLVVTEVNPRLSGVTPVVAASTGCGSAALAVLMATGSDPAFPPRPRRHACDFPFPMEAFAAMSRRLAARPGFVHAHWSAEGYLPRCYLAAPTAMELRDEVRAAGEVLGVALEDQLDERLEALRRLAPVEATAADRGT